MKKKIIIVILAILILGGLFYWFEIRKALAYRSCGIENNEWIKSVELNGTPYEEVRLIFEMAEWKFFNCLNQKGIK